MKIAIVFHSRFGHTARLAENVAAGARENAAVEEVRMMSVDKLDKNWLDRADAIIFGAPTYMGGMSSPLKQFMDETSPQWFHQHWKDKIAAGFTNSGSTSGDKLNTLLQMAIFAAQHGMIWVGQAEKQSGHGAHDINRMGSHLGLMAQSDNAPVEQTPPAGDLETARLFGARIAAITHRFVHGALRPAREISHAS